MSGEAKRNASAQKAKIARALAEECHRQVDEFLTLTDPESGEQMLDVLIGMLAHDFVPTVTIEMHPVAEIEDGPQLVKA